MNARMKALPADRSWDDDSRWAAVCARDVAADGHFVYAVRTTGVYCRPSCASRRARRENVSFHADPAAAEAAGFRACKRCQPAGGGRQSRHLAAITRACALIEDSATLPELDQLAAAADMSPYHFHRVFKRVTGLTPRAYAAARRKARMRDALVDGASVTAAIYDAGFNSNGRFYAASGAALGMHPSAYRDGGAGETIRFAVGQCALGSILVAATARGLCAIALGDEPQALVHELEDRFHRAELVGGDPAFEATVARVIGFVEEPRRGLDLPLDIRGTAFQERVWQALAAIPPGRTVSYGEIAAAIGQPAAVRAVAGACAANTLAVAIPCHRVVRADGSLSGYRWGVARKRALLAREAGG
ncbi:MAG: bifunctional DNA-binding transcriptional regulator/O6-methylguanine-DNA methyltransferase Ada [Gammaproteobacteria bacterium]|nr:bifunctional DNA-binding transcriptional regulator/O6-methylguanine-DNA methyltransferase Ada [Gammaproteobacteria bacterium]MCP5201164.1 bifunctional DNA-binding transcriptional regulator/O6-methylguanine-DNA methyltransferase Ada [Gammaproteobacteria bacterium]